MMLDTMKFFREGPNWSTFDPRGSFEQPAVLIHEISSCEPCFSWSFFHSHQLKDRPRYLEAMYALLTGAHSRKTFIQCETRGGITGIPAIEGIYLIRLCVVDDLIEDDALHLMRLTPKAWLKADHLTRFEDVPTIYGPVTVRFQRVDDGETLDVHYSSTFHHAPKKVVLHIPPLSRVKRVTINGESREAKAGDTLVID
jgi:hypothetical protein